MLEESKIMALASSFRKRTPAAQRLLFGQRRVKTMRALIHWAKDFRCCSLSVTIDGLNLTTFNAAIEESARR